jgi:large subunit ribosomal protein L4e
MAFAARPTVTVAGTPDTVALPAVFTAPIRPDIVHLVHTQMAKNSRQAYSVNRDAGHQTAAESWGTGRAVSRIPRVTGGGTSRSGQGAFGNMCRGGRMFAPTKVWRKWHKKINQNQRRYAVASALAASAVPALVMARGHRVSNVPEIPCVLPDSVESITKTSAAYALCQEIGADEDIEHVRNSRTTRAGRGKMRNRRTTQRRGPLVVYNEDKGITRAFRNLPGVELQHVSRLNLLQLAPGGHVGRFIIFSKSAFAALSELYENKTGFNLPRHIMSNGDLSAIVNSDAIQSALNPAKKSRKTHGRKKNGLKNLGVMVKLNPYATTLRRSRILGQGVKTSAAVTDEVAAARKAQGQRFYERIIAEGSASEESSSEEEGSDAEEDAAADEDDEE